MRKLQLEKVEVDEHSYCRSESLGFHHYHSHSHQFQILTGDNVCNKAFRRAASPFQVESLNYRQYI